MKPVVLGMAQSYPGYSCEQVTIVASHILDTIVAFGQTRHNINGKLFTKSRILSVISVSHCKDSNSLSEEEYS
jgi:hypothetical protein